MNHTRIMILTSTALLSVGYGVMWYFGIFEGLGFHGTIAAILGVVLTSAVGVALMTLLFRSSRGHYDERADEIWNRRRRR
ncbi:MAG TPA: hypothetical protein VNR88_00575 [Hyphomicrobium sp.]|nr:hypothetical protein [Hyphomicrobium sp.]